MAAWDLAAISVGSRYEALINETDSKAKAKYDQDSAFAALARRYDNKSDVAVASPYKTKNMKPSELAKIGTRDGRFVTPFQVS